MEWTMSTSIDEKICRRYGFAEIPYCRDESCFRDEKDHVEDMPPQRFRALTMTPSHYTDSDDEDEYYEDNGLWNQLVETLRKHELNGSKVLQKETTLVSPAALKLMNSNSSPESCESGSEYKRTSARTEYKRPSARKKRKVMSCVSRTNTKRNRDLETKDFENMHVFFGKQLLNAVFGKQLLNVFDSEHGSKRNEHYNAVQPLELGFSEALSLPRLSDVPTQQTPENDGYLEAVQRYRNAQKRQQGDKRQLNLVSDLLSYYKKLYRDYSYMPVAQAIGEEDAWRLAHILLDSSDDTKVFLSIWESIVTLGLSPRLIEVLEVFSFLYGDSASRLIRERVLHRARTVTWHTARTLIRELIEKLQIDVAREEKNFMDSVSPPKREHSYPGSTSSSQDEHDGSGPAASIELTETNPSQTIEVDVAFVDAKVYVTKTKKPHLESPRSSSSSFSKFTNFFLCTPEGSLSGDDENVRRMRSIISESDLAPPERKSWRGKVTPRSSPSRSTPGMMKKSFSLRAQKMSKYSPAKTVFANFHSKTPYDRPSSSFPPAPTLSSNMKKKHRHKKPKKFYLKPGTPMKISRPVGMICRKPKKRFSEFDLETVHGIFKRRIPEINLNVLPRVSPRDLCPGDIIFIYDYREQGGRAVQRISNCAHVDMDLQHLRTTFIHEHELTKNTVGKPVPVKVRHVMVCTEGPSHSGAAQTAHVTLRRARMSTITTPVRPSDQEVRRKVSFMQMGMQEATLPLCYQAVVYRLSGFLSCSTSIAATAAKCIERSVILPRVMDVDFVLTEPEHKDGFLKKSGRSLFRTAVREKFDKGISFVNLYSSEFMILCVHRAIYQLFKEKRSFESIHAILDIDPINPWPSISHSYMHDQKEWSLLGHLNFQFQ